MSRLSNVLAPTQWFSGPRDRAGAEDDRLHDLYWNRAQLKKEYAKLRKERYKLIEALTDEEGKTARLRQKLEFLEDSLADPETAGNAVVFYSLRKIWARCQQRLVALSSELKAQREAHATKRLRAQFYAEKQRDIQRIKNEIGRIEATANELESEADGLALALDESTSVFGWFKRRGLRVALDANRLSQQQTSSELQASKDSLAVTEAKTAPEFERLDVESRRAINCTVIALAEILAGHYRDGNFLDWLTLAQEKSVGSARFGDPQACAHMLKKLKAHKLAFEQREKAPEFTAELSRMARAIRQASKYKRDDDGTPDPASLYAFGNNVLSRDTWNVSHAMLL